MKKEIRINFSFIKFYLVVICLVIWSLPSDVNAVLGVGRTNNYFKYTGYLRTWASVNLSDFPETGANDYGRLNMLRGSVNLDFEAQQGMFLTKLITRFDREYKTKFMGDIEDEVESTNAWLHQLLGEATALVNAGSGFTAGNSYDIGGESNDIVRGLESNDFSDVVREAWLEFTLFDRVSFRLGKQQVVWGETDFFRAMDLVHGFDYRWRLFMEPENEELRKPLVMANVTVQVPELMGSLQLLFRPGWDRRDSIGDRYQLGGGRWAPTPYAGLDFTSILKYDYRYKNGDVKDPTGGLRWTGVAGPVEYSFAYLRTYNDDFVINSRTFPKHDDPSGIVGDFVHPFVNIYGFTLNYYEPFTDTVLSTEIVYTPKKPYTTGSASYPNFYVPADADDMNLDDAFGVPLGTLTLGAVGATTNPALVNIPVSSVIEVQNDGVVVIKNNDLHLINDPGFSGIKRKDTLMMMFRVDKNLNALQPIIRTYKPPFLSIQFFDKWITNFHREDELIIMSPYGARKKEHSSILTAVLMMHYKNETLNPTLAAGWDITYGGGFFFPSCEFVFGDHWRLRAEADFFFQSGHKKYSSTEIDPLGILNLVDPDLSEHPNTGLIRGGIQKSIETDTKFFGFLDRRDQFLLRLTYQF